MITVRNQVFETNSSSCHSVTLGTELRPIEEFPLPDKDVVIQIELPITKDWCEGFKTFNDYLILALMYINGGEKLTGWTWSPNGDDQVDLLRWINIVYARRGLPHVNSIKLSWTGFVEFKEDGSGISCGDADDTYYVIGSLQSGYGLEEFLRSMAQEVGPDSKLPGIEKIMEPIKEEDYKANVAMYNAAVAVVYNTTSCICEDH